VEKTFAVVSGNMGVGKSTLVEKLAGKLGWQAVFEPQDENPYLADFYRDMKSWALHSQLFFLGRRFKQYQELLASPRSVFQDRCVYEDAEVFARNLYEQEKIPERDWQVYRSIYEGVLQFVPPPSLLIYLQADLPTLRQRIEQRGRDYEQGMQPDYLEGLQRLYERWIRDYRLSPVLVIPADRLDFVKEEKHLDQIAQAVMEKLSGHETLEFDRP
jgi:deoxyadenosine/deoxycytidine kinase